jgi:MFS family permease
VLSGLPFTLSWVGAQTSLLLSVPHEVRGRIVGTTGALYAAILLAATLSAGTLAELVGVRWVLGVTAATAVLGLLAVDRLVRTPVADQVPA